MSDEIDAEVVGAACAVERHIVLAQGRGDGVFVVRAFVECCGDFEICTGGVDEERGEVMVVFGGSFGDEVEGQGGRFGVGFGFEFGG